MQGEGAWGRGHMECRETAWEKGHMEKEDSSASGSAGKKVYGEQGGHRVRAHSGRWEHRKRVCSTGKDRGKGYLM